MNPSTIRFTDEDVTTVYDALLCCNGHDLASALLAADAPQGIGATAPGSAVLALAARRVSSVLALLRAVGPNREESSRIILPWKASHLAMLSQLSWPDALGLRIALPSHVGPRRRARLLANVLLGLSRA